MDHCICDQPETWRYVPGWEGLYQVSDHGRVFSVRANRCLKLTPNVRHRYLSLALCRDSRPVRMKVHHMVLWAFVGPCPAGLECCHWDDDRTHNCLGNLRWDTQAANMRDRIRNGRDGNHNRYRTHCQREHPLSGDNLYLTPKGRRQCRACARWRVGK